MSFPRYPSYKDSGTAGLGEIPSHWEVKPLKHLAAIDSCGSYGVEVEEAEIALPVATTAQIDADGRFTVDRMPVRGFVPAEVQRFGCSDGDILVVKSSGSATNIISGKAGLVDESTPPFVFSNFLMRVRPSRDLAIPKFIYALLRSQLTRQRVEQMCSTTTYPNLQVGEYCSAPLPIPPPAEQTQIAAFLDRETAKIDELVAEQRRLMELLKEKRQAVISHAVTQGLNPHAPMKPSGIEWLGDVPEHWEVKKIKFVTANVKAGPFGSALTKDVYVGAGYRVYGQEQVIPNDFTLGDYFITPAKYDELSQYSVSPGDILISCVGTFGKIAIVPDNIEPGIINPRLIRLRCSHAIKAEYLVEVMRSNVTFEQFSSFTRGGTMDVINIGTLNEIYIALPPMEEQQELLSFVQREISKFDTLTAEAQRAIDLLQERRTALISAAVTGQIDVRQLTEERTA